MKRNPLGFLSLLALIGIFGFITPNRALLGFWGFAVYFRYFFVIADELFQQNVRQSAAIGFFSGTAVMAISVVGRVLFPQLIGKELALVSNFLASMLCFTLALLWFELKETRGD